MFLELAHTKLDVFKVSKELLLACYRETKDFPSEERFEMFSQIRRAALSVNLNIAESCSRKSVAERKRFFEISRGSIIEIDTAFDVAIDLNYTTKENLDALGILMVRSFSMISKMIS